MKSNGRGKKILHGIVDVKCGSPKQPQQASRQEDTAPVCIGGGGVIGDLRDDGGRGHG